MAGLTKNKSKFEEYYKLPSCHKLIMVSSAHFKGTHWVSSWYLHAPRQILWFPVGAHYWNLNFWVPFKIHLETKFWDGFPSKLTVGSILIWVKFYTVLLWRGIFLIFFIFWTINKEQVFNIIIVDFFFFCYTGESNSQTSTHTPKAMSLCSFILSIWGKLGI